VVRNTGQQRGGEGGRQRIGKSGSLPEQDLLQQALYVEGALPLSERRSKRSIYNQGTRKEKGLIKKGMGIDTRVRGAATSEVDSIP